jgi:23S rRNA pseudouridine1911/1915/1917 synthase
MAFVPKNIKYTPEVEIIEMKISAFQSVMRLDKYLVKELPNYMTRNQIQIMLKNGKICVNGKKVKASYPIQPHDFIRVESEKPYDPPLYGENIPLDILYEDDYLMVINKQAGLVVHPGAGTASNTLVNGLIYHSEFLSNENGPLRPGIVHRLDKDTTGVIITVKDNTVHNGISQQFEKRTLDKHYLALVWGTLKENSGTINQPIGRSSKDRAKFAVTADGKASVTHYEVVEEFRFLTLLKIKLETGRTHQIRVHMSHINHPVFGDPHYNGRNQKMITLNLKDRRIASQLLELTESQVLHAQDIEFVHPMTKEKLKITAPLHEEFKEILRILRSDAE